MIILPRFDIAISSKAGSIGLMDPDRLLPDDPNIPDRTRIKLQSARKAVYKLRAGWRPGPDLLNRAPRLYDWTFEETWPGHYVLMGAVVGHPLLCYLITIHTSLLLGLDARNLAWARTISRFYALGEPRVDGTARLYDF